MYGPEVEDFIKFESDSNSDMINWNKFELTEPPCLQLHSQSSSKYFNVHKKYSNYQVSRKNINLVIFTVYRCHSRYIEHFVHIVHESAIAVTDEQRMGHIFSNLRAAKNIVD